MRWSRRQLIVSSPLMQRSSVDLARAALADEGDDLARLDVQT
jgi:hypothetical protein